MKLWVPIDFYLGASVHRDRLLEVPTRVLHHVGNNRAIRFECCVLLHVCIIIDFKPLYVGNHCSDC